MEQLQGRLLACGSNEDFTETKWTDEASCETMSKKRSLVSLCDDKLSLLSHNELVVASGKSISMLVRAWNAPSGIGKLVRFFTLGMTHSWFDPLKDKPMEVSWNFNPIFPFESVSLYFSIRIYSLFLWF